MGKYISLPVFIVSLAVGILSVYLWGVDRKIVYVFPNPENATKVQYQDNNDTCYYYKYKTVACPADESKVSSFPMQI